MVGLRAIRNALPHRRSRRGEEREECRAAVRVGRARNTDTRRQVANENNVRARGGRADQARADVDQDR